jgi:hypothetical protein
MWTATTLLAPRIAADLFAHLAFECAANRHRFRGLGVASHPAASRVGIIYFAVT